MPVTDCWLWWWTQRKSLSMLQSLNSWTASVKVGAQNEEQLSDASPVHICKDKSCHMCMLNMGLLLHIQLLTSKRQAAKQVSARSSSWGLHGCLGTAKSHEGIQTCLTMPSSWAFYRQPSKHVCLLCTCHCSSCKLHDYTCICALGKTCYTADLEHLLFSLQIRAGLRRISC